MRPFSICLLSRYPPSEGGVSAGSFWLARWLASAGCRVTVVTNSSEEPWWHRIYMRPDDEEFLSWNSPSGGEVRVVTTDEPSPARNGYHPYANPFVTKLAARAATVCERDGVDFLLANYFEPYGFAAALVSSWFGIPYGLQHAGSDLYRLAALPDRCEAFRQLMGHATLILCTRRARQELEDDGVPPERLVLGMPSYVPATLFNPVGPTLDLDALVKALDADGMPVSWPSRSPTNPNRPVIGMYGKPGRRKATLQVIEAVGRLRQAGIDSTLFLMVGVHRPYVDTFNRSVEANGLTDRTVMLPFLPHWRVPEFIRSCDVVAYLENNFSITAHRPMIPREISMCGRAAVVSSEVATNLRTQEPLVDGQNMFLVEDPRNVEGVQAALGRAVQDLALTHRMGGAAAALFAAGNPTAWTDRLLDRMVDATGQSKVSTDMTLHDFQQVCAKLYTSSAFRGRFTRDPRAVLAEHRLSRAEEDALLTLQTTLLPHVEAYALSLLGKNFHHAWARYGLTRRVCRDAGGRLRAQFNSEYDFAARTVQAELAWFHELAQRTLAPTTGSLLQDTLTFDYTRAIVSSSRAAGDNDESTAWDGPVADGAILQPADGIVLRDFVWNVADLYSGKALQPSEVPGTLAFAPPATSDAVRVLRLSFLVGCFLRSLDGSDSFRAAAGNVWKASTQRGDEHDFVEHLRAAVGRLGRLGLVVMADSGRR